MIDETKLINELRNCFVPMEYPDGRGINDMAISAYDEGIYDAIYIIEHQPKINGWIPCSERLPDDVKDEDYYPLVIICKLNGTVTCGYYRNYDKEWFGINRKGKHEYLFDKEVIAWKPLPQPYEEEK